MGTFGLRGVSGATGRIGSFESLAGFFVVSDHVLNMIPGWGRGGRFKFMARGYELLKSVIGVLMGAAVLWHVGNCAGPTAVYAARSCSPVASPETNIVPSASFGSAATVITAFNSARQSEG